MRVKFLYPADIELDEAFNYYNHQLPGLGYRLIQEISSAIDRIKLMPDAWTKVGKNTRRCLIKGFPYAILFSIEENIIVISAIANLHRNPIVYAERLR